MAGSDDEGLASTEMRPSTLGDTVPASRQSRPAIDGLASGTTLGRYRLVARLGSGAMGVVWSAHDPQLDRLVAIKLLHPRMGDTSDAATRLLREARAMAKLSHRNVITVHDAGDIDGHLFIAMEMIEGTTLGAMLRARPPGPPDDWRRWLALLVDAGHGLAAAHARGVLHRDFKPDNVLVDSTGRACVGDFGVARLGESEPVRAASSPSVSAATDLTHTGALIGTPLYMSPQQLRGESLDARADQFAFCVTAWEALYGERPFPITGTSYAAMGELLETIERGALPPAPAASHVPAGIRTALVRGLAAEPAARWPELAPLLVTLEEVAREVPRPTRRTWPLVIGALGVVVGAAIALSMTRTRASHEVEPVHLFDVALLNALALSPDGRFLAIDNDVLEVRPLDGRGPTWTRGLDGKTIHHLELDERSLRFTVTGSHSVLRWDFATTGDVTTEIENVGGRWDGTTAFGELIYRTDGSELAVVDGARQHLAWKTGSFVNVDAISPNGKRVAYIQAARFRGTIVVKDLATGNEVVSPILPEPTAVTWLDDSTLLYATGTSSQPTLYRMPLAASGLGSPSVVFQRPRGWFGNLVARGATVLLTELAPASRAKFYDLEAMSSRDLDSSKVGAALTWISRTEYLTWNASTGLLDRRSTTGEVTRTSISLPGEPAGATVADGTLIVVTRESGGRRVAGHDLATGRVLWTGPDLDTLAVRCAGDLHPPCFAIRANDLRDRVVRFDPATGRTGELVYQRPEESHVSIDDLAVRVDGAELVLAGQAPSLLVVTPTGKELRSMATPLQITRSIAFDSRGGLLVAGTAERGRYQLGSLGEAYRMLAQSDIEQLSLVRPSPEGSYVLVLARKFEPTISRLDLPAR